MPKKMKRHFYIGGFTLIEVMITVVIISILASIAYPAYINHVDRSRRSEGMSMLLIVASQQERFYTRNNSYATDVEIGNVMSENNYYTITSDGDGDGVVDVAGVAYSSYRLTATPNIAIWTDAFCGNFTLTSAGVREVSGNTDGDAADGDSTDGNADVADVDDINACWR
jgi:type IV pilus assembly protein PilE